MELNQWSDIPLFDRIAHLEIVIPGQIKTWWNVDDKITSVPYHRIPLDYMVGYASPPLFRPIPTTGEIINNFNAKLMNELIKKFLTECAKIAAGGY